MGVISPFSQLQLNAAHFYNLQSRKGGTLTARFDSEDFKFIVPLPNKRSIQKISNFIIKYIMVSNKLPNPEFRKINVSGHDALPHFEN